MLYSYGSSSKADDSNHDSNASFCSVLLVLQSDDSISDDNADDDNNGVSLVIPCLSGVNSGKESDTDNYDVFVLECNWRTRHISQPPTCDSLTDDSSEK